MDPFDQPPATPPAAAPIGEPPVGPRRSSTRRVAIAAAAVGLAGVGVFGITQFASADRSDDDASASSETTIEAPDESAARVTPEAGDEQIGGSSEVPAVTGAALGDIEGLDELQECLEQQFPDGPFGDDFAIDEFLEGFDPESFDPESFDIEDFDIDDYLGDFDPETFDPETFDPESLDLEGLLEDLDLDRLLEDLDIEGLDLENLGDPSGFTIGAAEPGESRVFGDAELFGQGGTSVTVVDPDGVTMYQLGEGDGSINIAQSDGAVTVTTEGDVTVVELADLFGSFDFEQFCAEAPLG